MEILFGSSNPNHAHMYRLLIVLAPYPRPTSPATITTAAAVFTAYATWTKKSTRPPECSGSSCWIFSSYDFRMAAIDLTIGSAFPDRCTRGCKKKDTGKDASGRSSEGKTKGGSTATELATNLGKCRCTTHDLLGIVSVGMRPPETAVDLVQSSKYCCTFFEAGARIDACLIGPTLLRMSMIKSRELDLRSNMAPLPLTAPCTLSGARPMLARSVL